ncbi:Fc.00g108310.m01.CDS01 [Cosmosporella sp. VM-42]
MDAVSDAARESPDSGHGIESQTKRRKVRKGTHSCWQCKRRKIRCSFVTPGDSVCIECRKRGTTCVSQQYPLETGAATSLMGDRALMGDRIVRVEALIEQLAKQVSNGSNPSTTETTSSTLIETGGPNSRSVDGTESTCFSTPYEPSAAMQTPHWGLKIPGREGPRSSLAMPTPVSLVTQTASTPSEDDKISAALHAALPPREDIHLMIKAGIDVSFDKFLTYPYDVVAQEPGGWKANLRDIPEEKAHPTLLAKYLLILATCLQYVNPDLHAEEISRLSEPPHQLMRRLGDVAINLVTKNDEYLGSVEGLECVLLEAMYQGNSGNLRRAWLACRRGMVVAQMMGVHRTGSRQPLKVIDPEKVVYSSYIWFRLVWMDRQLCLMLGLPQGTLDVSIASEAALATDSGSSRFERKQSIIASRILERNESSDPAVMEDLVALQELDVELRKAANEMPSKWWLAPNLANIADDPDISFWGTLHLLEQILYFNLVNLLHLPYMLRSSTPESERGKDGANKYNYEYSKLASVNASRELLTRFITFRSFNRVAFCCRSVDFHALTAAMTLVIAHLAGHRQQRRVDGVGIRGINVLAHQRNSDRAMMDQVLEIMEGVAKLNSDALSERSSCLLKSLLVLEADAAEGKQGTMDQDYFATAAAMTELHPDSATDDGQSLWLSILYFGTIRIGRDGVISMEAPQRSTPSLPTQKQQEPTKPTGSSPTMQSSENSNAMAHNSDHLSSGILPPRQPSFDDMVLETPPIPAQSQQATQSSAPTAQLLGLQEHQPFAPQFPNAINGTLQQQYLYPGLTAGADDWAFQGVDMTFFDSLIRGSGGENVGDGSSWTDWEDTL